MSEKVLYTEKYRLKQARIEDDFLPECKHVPEDQEPVEAYLEEAGRVERDGEPLEYQVIRVYFRERK